MNVRVTIAVCTFNRAESLRRTLSSLEAMYVPGGLDWEIVVVNNNSRDQTDFVIESFADRLPVHREFEAQAGLSHARNRAIHAATGDYIIWTDDDVVVDPKWLDAYTDAFRCWPDAAVFGGRITPRYECPAVKWIREAEPLLAGPLAIRDFGEQCLPLSIEEERLPFGANFAVRSAEQRLFRFDPELGVGPSRLRLGEEIDVIERILRSGAVGYWVPSARVEHCIGLERQKVAYFERYFAGWGETVAYRAGKTGGPLLLGAPRWLWRRAFTEWVRYTVHRRISAAPIWVRHLKAYATAWGAIRYWRNTRE